MTTKLSCTSTLPWIWVIVALASVNEIDTLLLINLIKRTSEISDDLGRNAREMVSLRVLENIFVRETSNANNVVPVPGGKIELDPSERCEDVLRRLLLEVSASDLNMVGPEMLKWDILSFIMKKRSRLPKCGLQQLKDAILDASCPTSASLKEISGLEVRNCYGDELSVDVVDSDGLQGLKVRDMNAQHVAPNGNLKPFTRGSLNGILENQPESSLVPAKRSIDASVAYDKELKKTEALSENSSDPCLKSGKKFKQEVVNPIRNVTPDLVLSQRDGIPVEPCKESQPIVGKGNLEDEARVVCFEANGSLNSDSGKHVASGVGQSSGSSHNEPLPQRLTPDRKIQNIGSSSNRCAELRTSSGLSHHAIQQDSCTHDTKCDLECNIPQNLHNEPSKGGKVNIERSHEPEFFSDSSGYHNEIIDLAAKKNDYLNSQCSQREDSLSTINCTEFNVCMKCNEGGKLFVCSSNTCPLVVHETCLGSDPNFDNKGNFYCPFCAYSLAISKYLEGEKKVSLARKDLSAFFGFGARK